MTGIILIFYIGYLFEEFQRKNRLNRIFLLSDSDGLLRYDEIEDSACPGLGLGYRCRGG